MERVRASVFTYCEQNCPPTGKNLVILDGTRPIWVGRSNQRYNKNGQREFVGVTQEGDYYLEGFALNLCGLNIPIDEHSPMQDMELAYRIFGLQALDSAAVERDRVKPLIDCIENSAFMYKLYIDGDLGNQTNRFNFAESFGKLKRAKTAYKNDNPRR